MAKNTRASKKQQELLLFIDGFIKGNGYGPSYREVMRALDYKSVSTVAIHVNQLITKGYLEKKDNSARSLSVVTLRQDTPDKPVVQLPDVIAFIESKRDQVKSDDDKQQLQAALEILKVRD